MRFSGAFGLLSLLLASDLVQGAHVYRLKSKVKGSSLLKSFNFETGHADNNGRANYLSLKSAKSKGLVSTNKAGAVTFKVSTKNGQAYRDSQRLVSKTAYSNGGLFIYDVAHMPTGCGLWPSIWMVGPNWPAGGEIDIIEGVHAITQNSMSTHTGSGCVQQTSGFSASFMMNTQLKNQCNVYSTSAQGCGVRSKSKSSYGAPFNSKGGGVYALQWDSNGIKTYHWSRKSIPADVKAGKPKPSAKWGKPENFVHYSKCSPYKHFNQLRIVINTNLCGTWGSGVWSQDLSYAGSPGSCKSKTGFSTCEAFVKSKGSAFKDAYWKINSIAVYK